MSKPLRITLQTGVVLLMMSRMGPAQGVEAPNWPAPLHWTAGDVADKASAERSAALSGPLPLIAVSPCRLVDTRAEYAGLGFSGPFGSPQLAGGQQRVIPVPSGNCGFPGTPAPIR
ncbi:MAG: hypothetical protein IT167_27805 [Bryobacterales bacterium]|nr:hypothetical protein [Bryobacterales bacterium]